MKTMNTRNINVRDAFRMTLITDWTKERGGICGTIVSTDMERAFSIQKKEGLLADPRNLEKMVFEKMD